MGAMRQYWDIFCRVIDNYGDIGVCWRLARQLTEEHGLTVRLWVDAPEALAPLYPALDTQKASQTVEGIEVLHWMEPFPATNPANVVVEAFACDLPATYLAAMSERSPKPFWINLEYLSAENWVEDCHGLASPHPSLPLNKYFFFPGFTERTGGLLREATLLQTRDASMHPRSSGEPLDVSLFCYNTAPIAEMLDIWANGGEGIRCHVAQGNPLEVVKRYFGGPGPWRVGNLEATPIPFIPQRDFDRLLWQCDINFVRGEDSFVRAQWAAKPLVWQIYPQEEGAHLVKLNAFLARYTSGTPVEMATAIRKIFLAWNGSGNLADAWADFVTQHSAIKEHGRKWSKLLADQDDLAANLVKFYRVRL